jgi:hypothetical protein
LSLLSDKVAHYTILPSLKLGFSQGRVKGDDIAGDNYISSFVETSLMWSHTTLLTAV